MQIMFDWKQQKKKKTKQNEIIKNWKKKKKKTRKEKKIAWNKILQTNFDYIVTVKFS